MFSVTVATAVCVRAFTREFVFVFAVVTRLLRKQLQTWPATANKQVAWWQRVFVCV
jgi:hypothetical protein